MGARSAWRDPASLVTVAVVAAYFAVGVVPSRNPSFGATSFFFWYVLSVPVVLGALLFAGALAVVLRLRSPARCVFIRRLAVVSIGGLVAFAAALAAAAFLSRALPTGSFTMNFDANVWKSNKAAEYVAGDITVRQKMLGDVVTRVLPGRSREEIEALLGPPLDTQYFQSTGRDLIYLTGPQRDSWFAIDSEWLLVWVDREGKFERCEVYTD